MSYLYMQEIPFLKIYHKPSYIFVISYELYPIKTRYTVRIWYHWLQADFKAFHFFQTLWSDWNYFWHSLNTWICTGRRVICQTHKWKGPLQRIRSKNSFCTNKFCNPIYGKYLQQKFRWNIVIENSKFSRFTKHMIDSLFCHSTKRIVFIGTWKRKMYFSHLRQKIVWMSKLVISVLQLKFQPLINISIPFVDLHHMQHQNCSRCGVNFINVIL